MGDAGEDNMGDPGVDEVEMREVLYRDGLKSRVPGVVSLEVGPKDEVPEGMLVLVEDGPHLTHVGDPVVVFGTQGEFSEVAKCGNADCVKVPATETGFILFLLEMLLWWRWSTYMEARLWIWEWVESNVCTISAPISGYPIHSKSTRDLNSGSAFLNMPVLKIYNEKDTGVESK